MSIDLRDLSVDELIGECADLLSQLSPESFAGVMARFADLLQTKNAKLEAENERLRGWLRWISVDDTDAQAALRGEPAKGV